MSEENTASPSPIEPASQRKYPVAPHWSKLKSICARHHLLLPTDVHKKQFKTGHAQLNRPVVAGSTVTTGDSGTLTPHGKGHSHGNFSTPSLSRATDVPEVAQHRPEK